MMAVNAHSEVRQERSEQSDVALFATRGLAPASLDNTPRVPPSSSRLRMPGAGDDRLQPARGIAVGLALAAVGWGTIGALWWWLH
jgi:hypothetical protein